jgi:hypothetical protein
MNILLVEPDFPIPDKSKNHAHFLPIGLLKIGSWHRLQGDKVRLVRGLKKTAMNPDRILITSLFTYWSQHVHSAATFYHSLYPKAEIEIGGIYASLMPEHCRINSQFAKVRPGLYESGKAECTPVELSLLGEALDYQIIHTTRGCNRHCSFCGTWRIEPQFTYKESIIREIQKPRIVFYDNNFLANPHVDDILEEIAQVRFPNGRRLICESQSGFDLRFLSERRANLLRKARFVFPRIAWDGPYTEWPKVKERIEILKGAGYGRKDIFVFMLYNHNLSYVEMRAKLDACRRWDIRVIDCRFRPLDQTYDNYVPGQKAQTNSDYYIHPEWTDRQVRKFRQAVRHQNIAVLLALPNNRYINGCESRMMQVA